MNSKQVQALEGYFKTDNDHWNSYTFKMICKVLEDDNFENPEIPIKTFSKCIDILTEHYETPLKVFQILNSETDKHKFSKSQKLFVFEWIYKYLRNTDFECSEMYEIEQLINSKIESIKAQVNKEPEYNKPLVGNIRDTLKDVIKIELEQLPETLKELEAIQRLNILCKLIPYVLPKVEAVHSEKGEPDKENKTTFSGYQW